MHAYLRIYEVCDRLALLDKFDYSDRNFNKFTGVLFSLLLLRSLKGGKRSV